MAKLAAHVAEGECGAMGEDAIARVRAAVAVAVVNSSVAKALQLRGSQAPSTGTSHHHIPLPPMSEAEKAALHPERSKQDRGDAGGRQGEKGKKGGKEKKEEEESAAALNPSYSCDASVVRITKQFAFFFGPSPVHPYVCISL